MHKYQMAIYVNGAWDFSPIRFGTIFAASCCLDDWGCVTHATNGCVIDTATGEVVKMWKPW